MLVKLLLIIISFSPSQVPENEELIKMETPQGTIYAYKLHHNEEDVYTIKNFEYKGKINFRIENGYCVLGKTIKGYTEAIIFPSEKTEFKADKFKGDILYVYFRFPPDWFENNLKDKIKKFEGKNKENILKRGIKISEENIRFFFHVREYVFWIENLTGGVLATGPDTQYFFIGTLENKEYTLELFPFKRRKGGKLSPYFEKMWNLYETKYLKVYYPENSIIKDTIKEWTKRREEAFENICKFLGIDWKFGKIKIFVFNDNEQAKMYGLKPLGFANPMDNSVFTRVDQTPGHEIAHVVSYRIKGKRINSSLINNGLATLLDNTGRNYHRISKYLLYEKKIECNILGENFRKCPFGYFLGASFVKFLIDKYGLEKFKEFFAQEDYDEEKAFENFYGKKGEELIKEWKEFLKKKDFGKLSEKEERIINKIEKLINKKDT